MINERNINRDDKFKYDWCSQLSWKAIFAGALVSIGLSFLLNLFSVAIGLTAFHVDAGTTTIAIGGFIGVAIGVFAAMFTSGMVAGYLGRSHCPKRHLGSLYGFLAWCVALILTTFIAAHIASYVDAYNNFITNPKVTVNTEMVKKTEANGSTEIMIDNQKAEKGLAIGAFAIFVLFFLGAFSSCIGGHYGMTCRCKNDEMMTTS